MKYSLRLIIVDFAENCWSAMIMDSNTLMRKLVVLAIVIKRGLSTKAYLVCMNGASVCTWIFLIAINKWAWSLIEY